jgi:argininosuccinate lyase
VTISGKERRTVRSAISISALVLCCLIVSPANAQKVSDAERDAFHWLSEINKASTVMVTETGIVPLRLGREIAVSVNKVIVDANADRKLRSGDYLKVEPLLIAAGGADVTRLHSGRSRQDIGATSRRLTQREQILATMLSLDKARSTLLDFAAKHPDAIIPAYTWGVQAQPTSFGHYLLGYTQVLERQAVRMRSAFEVTIST